MIQSTEPDPFSKPRTFEHLSLVELISLIPAWQTWDGTIDANISRLSYAARWLTFLVLDETQRVFDPSSGMVNATATATTNSDEDDNDAGPASQPINLYPLRVAICDALFTALYALTRPSFSEEFVGALGVIQYTIDMIPAYWEAPTWTDQFEHLSPLTRRATINYTRPGSITPLLRAINRQSHVPTRHELAQIAAYLAIVVRNTLEDWHAQGGASDEEMPALNRATRNALFTGLFVTAKPKAQQAEKLRVEVELKMDEAMNASEVDHYDRPRLTHGYERASQLFIEEFIAFAHDPDKLQQVKDSLTGLTGLSLRGGSRSWTEIGHKQ